MDITQSNDSETLLQSTMQGTQQDEVWRENVQKSIAIDFPLNLGQDVDPYDFEIIPEEDQEKSTDDEDGYESSESDTDEEEEEGGESTSSEKNLLGDQIPSKEKQARRKRKAENSNDSLKKRKKKPTNERRNIKKILTEKELDPQTLEAQKKERERLRRLELQKGLMKIKAAGSTKKVAGMLQPVEAPLTELPIVVDATTPGEKEKTSSSIVVISDDEDHLLDQEAGEKTLDKLEDVKDVIALLTSSEESSESEEEDESDEYVDAHMNDDLNVKTSTGKVLINVSHPADEPDIFVAPQIARAIQSHQIGGIRFLYDNLIESVKRANSSTGTGFGCILAHSMGLGKTVQTIAFIDVFLRYTSAKKVLCVVPINTTLNWVNEFNLWIPEGEKEDVSGKNKEETTSPATSQETPSTDNSETVVSESTDEKNEIGKQSDWIENEIFYRKYEVFALTDAQKTTIARGKVIGSWHQKGGVLLMGYEMYRTISLYQPSMCNSIAMTKGKKRKQKEKKLPMMIDVDEEDKEMHLMLGMQKAICKPGPDLVVCDEGHRIKNFHSNLSQALHKIKTRRRLVLTGYPLQNNLIEYWCMVDFVRPSYLGTRGEFSNMFERPIMNGQCLDSTPADKKLMRYRAHVLNSLLKGFVQRRDHSVLRKVLPAKEENVIMVRLSDAQEKLYRKFVTLCCDVYKETLNPIKLFSICAKIWNHPDILHRAMLEQTGENPEVLLDTDDDIGIGTGNGTVAGNGIVNGTGNSKKKVGAENSSFGGGIQNDSLTKALLNSVKHWATEVYSDMNYTCGAVANSGKMLVLLEIIHESLAQGDRLLIFSQSLLTLDLIEKFLSELPVPCYDSYEGMGLGSQRNWLKNRDYYRIDGRTASSERERLIRNFNSNSNEAKLFLLSTRAGCLGINLTGANRVVVFDVSWNPCHDAQAVCRVYRYGQVKKCHIYRLVASNTMEQRMYVRQVSKQGISDRVVDELNPGENFTKDEMHNLISTLWEPEPEVDFTDSIRTTEDLVMKKILLNCGRWIVKTPFQHESLLEDQLRNRLSRSEKKMARLAYEKEKRNTSGFTIYDNAYSRIRSDQKPVVIVSPTKRDIPQPSVHSHLHDNQRLPLFSEYLQHVNTLNRGPYPAGETFNRSMQLAGFSEQGYFSDTAGTDFSRPSVFNTASNTLGSLGHRRSTCDTSNVQNTALRVQQPYEPYRPLTNTSPSTWNQGALNQYPSLLDSHSVIDTSSLMDSLNYGSGQIDDGTRSTNFLTSIENSLSNIANTLLNYQSTGIREPLPSSSMSCRVAKNDDVIVIDVDD